LTRLSFDSLGTRLVAFSVALAVVSVASVFLLLDLGIRRQTRQFLAETLARQQEATLALQKDSLEELLRTSVLMTESPTLRAAMETYAAEASEAGADRHDLLATIQTEIEKVGIGLGRDLLILADAEGRVLASRPRAVDGPPTGPVVTGFSVLERAGAHYRAGSVPILLQGFPIGTLTVGDRIDARFVERLQRTFGGDVVVDADGTTIAATLPTELAGTMAQPGTAAATGAGEDGPRVVRAGREEYVAAVLTLGRDEAGREVNLRFLHSLTRVLEASHDSLFGTLLVTGLMAVALVGLAAWWMSRSLLRPLRSFVLFMRSVDEPGGEARHFEAGAASVEIRTLSDAFHHLMARLRAHEAELVRKSREKVDQVERLKESEKLAALGRMLSGAAHEINNPLAGVVGNVEIMLADPSLGAEARRRLETMRREGQRIVALVRNLLRIAHRDKGERVLVDVARVLTDTLALRRHDFEKEGMRLELAPGEGRLQVMGNELELQQVFLNIVNNAFDALKSAPADAPSLRVSAVAEDDLVTLTFTDNGPGLQEAHLVFDHFYTTKPVGQGTGLGLSISQAIVQHHGGRIAARNGAAGGAEFRVVLPAPSPQAAATSRPWVPEPAVAHPHRSLPATVLVVDDEPAVLELQMAILDSLGATATGVGSGPAAIEALSRRSFDLIISDLRMPGGVSGREFFAWVKVHRPELVPGFLFVTGDTIGAADFLEHSERPYVLKPFSMDNYVATLRQVLHDSRSAA